MGRLTQNEFFRACKLVAQAPGRPNSVDGEPFIYFLFFTSPRQCHSPASKASIIQALSAKLGPRVLQYSAFFIYLLVPPDVTVYYVVK